jgi:hypothetical protein
MKNIATTILLSTLLCGCIGPHGPIGKLPEVAADEESATVYILRNRNFMSGGVNFKVTLDSAPIFGIGIGEYTKFKVKEGKHIIGVICKGGWAPFATHINEKSFDMKAGEEYYAMARFGGVCAVIEPLTKEAGANLVASSKYVPIERQ